MSMIVDDGRWLLEEVANKKLYSKTLNTAGKFVDKNIDIKITAKDGALNAAATQTKAGTASMSASGFTATTTATSHYVNLATTAGTASATASVNTAGWVDDETATASANVAVSGNGNKLYIPNGAVSTTIADADLTAPKVLNIIAPTGFTPASSSTPTDHYVTLNQNVTNGSVVAKSTGSTTGMIDKDAALGQSTAKTIVPTVSGANSKIYIPDGDYNVSITTHSVTTTPSVTPTITGTVTNISTTTKPSGTEGTDYWMIKPDGTPTAGTASATVKATIPTAGYIDKDTTGKTDTKEITVTPAVEEGTKRYIGHATHVTAHTITNPSASAYTDGMDAGISTTETPYSIAVMTTPGSAQFDYAITAAGYTVTSDGVNDTKTIDIDLGNILYLKEAGITPSATATASITVTPGNVTLAKGAGAPSGKVKVDIAPTTDTTQIAKFYVPVKATSAATSGSKNITGTATADVTAGYAPANKKTSTTITGTATASVASKTSSEYYIPLTETVYYNQVSNPNDYVDVSDSKGVVLKSNDYLYIKEGYHTNEKISLKKLSPDGASAEYTTDDIVSGKAFYNNDGVLVAGSLPVMTFTQELHTNSTSPAGYDYYNVDHAKGYKQSKDTAVQIPVYQGDFVS